ncbi:S8 family serine peptidase [Lysobacter capsici]|uniref:S8 family peptidase n=1 Tax=Lysobacter capsici TaxID=435897 RepID=UPI00177BE32E|nr:S8 family serine peptidase [Lysobacter capsici]UOF13708.1 S8 family serine peptidase [Lysobacter capsici]
MSVRTHRTHALAVATALVLASTAGSAFAAERINLSGLQTAQKFDRFIVKYSNNSVERSSAANVQKALNAAANSTAGKTRGAAAFGLSHLRRTAIGADVVRSDRALDRSQAESLMRQIAADPNVEYVEVDVLRQRKLTPNDTHYGVQYGFNGANGGIRADQAWDLSTGTGSVVAVLDTGITPHSDLNANILPGYDFISDTFVSRDGDGRDSNPNDEGDWNNATECDSPGYDAPAGDSSWHGTHVAGTIAAVTNNAKGVAGTAFNAKVVPVRVLGRCGGYDSDISDAIVWASGGTVSGIPANANPAEVINMSLGGGGACPSSYQTAINGAVGRGTTIVVAAGNESANVSTSTPANCANVIAVAATTSTGAKASYSNYGTGIDVSAPGDQIASTHNSGTTTQGSEQYVYMSGTSMASPHVAGVVALLQSKATTPKTPAEIEALLKSTARALPGACSGGCGAGIVNAKAALDAVNGTTPPTGTQTYSNGTDYNIPDNNATGVSSSIVVSGRTGNAPSNASVTVNIIHPYKGDLIVDLIAPDGSVYNIHNRTGSAADNVSGTFTLNLSSEALNGTWKLRAADRAAQDIGRIDTWSITF